MLTLTMSLSADSVWDYLTDTASDDSAHTLTQTLTYDDAITQLNRLFEAGELQKQPHEVYFDQAFLNNERVNDVTMNIHEWETAQETLTRLDGVVSVEDLHEIAARWGDTLDEILVDRQIDAYTEYENAEKYGRALLYRMIDRKGFDDTIVSALYDAIDYQQFVGDILDRHNSYITDDGVLIADKRDLQHLVF